MMRGLEKKKAGNRRRFLKAAGMGTASLALTRSMFGSDASRRHAPPDDLAADWQTCKEVTLEFAQAMPAEHYPFRPGAEVRSFAEQMLHIAQSNLAMIAQSVKNEKPRLTDFTPEAAPSKADVIRLLTQSFDYVIATARALTPQEAERVVSVLQRKMPKWKVFYFAHDHTTHHRGQTVVYLRLKGIKPPEYRF